MYSKQEASAIRQKFWTSFGQYMRPVRGANGDTINWMNYKTGVRHIYFRMDADRTHASIAIEIAHPDPAIRLAIYRQFETLKPDLHHTVEESWNWEEHWTDEHQTIKSRISRELPSVDIFREEDWPSLISFLKPCIIALDLFWNEAKFFFEDVF